MNYLNLTRTKFTMSNKKFLFLDFDETLVSTLLPANEQQADQLLEHYSHKSSGSAKYELSDGWYVTFLRSWTPEFLTYCNNVHGSENFGILSRGTLEYIFAAVKNLNLEIKLSNIFGREDIPLHVPRFKNRNLVLVDNEGYRHHNKYSGKDKFMFHPPVEKFIMVPEFDIRYFDEDKDLTLDELIIKIDAAFDYID